jgi:hypothetical protein
VTGVVVLETAMSVDETNKLFTEVLTQDLNLRPRPALHVLGLSKTPGQAGSQVRGFRKTQVRSRS